jgi:hypothetical protein
MRFYLLILVITLMLSGCQSTPAQTSATDLRHTGAQANQGGGLLSYLPEVNLTSDQVKSAAMVVGAGLAVDGQLLKIPDRTISISPGIQMTLEKIVTWGALTGVAYMVIDPLAPNWEIEEAAFPGQRYHLALKMKRVYSGGAGEAHQVFQQRAKELMYQGGYDGFETLEYREGLDSSVIGSQRTARGVIRLTRR